MYECEEQKQHEKDHPKELSLCCHCAFFMHEADKCLEDSVITPVYRAYWNPDSKPLHFKDDGSKGKPMPIIYIPSVGGQGT